MSEYYSNSSGGERSSDTEYRAESESESDSEDRGRRRRRRRQTKKKKKKKKASLLKWQEEDEVTVLQQLYEFSGKNAACTQEFYEFVKEKLGRQVSMDQLRNKIRGLRRKYLEINGLKFCDDGQHQRKLFALSNRIWGAAADRIKNGGGGGSAVERHEKEFLDYLEDMEIDMDCLNPSSLEFLYGDWQIQKLMYLHLLSSKCTLDAKLRELFCVAPTHNSNAK